MHFYRNWVKFVNKNILIYSNCGINELFYDIEYTFNLKIINKNIHKNILEILDQNRFSIEVTFLYFSTNQLKHRIRTF